MMSVSFDPSQIEGFIYIPGVSLGYGVVKREVINASNDFLCKK